ncbi:hypothetical protein [Planococcus citreus]|uniref:Uncharacterized protein n=1 Tax=Planococcus citreus TaxID=1373 RepID=A0A497YGR3_9BACL|nr:hypothetical protein [Planococcus citreus]RLJ90148.1 hypothetical protein DFR62_0290 [Planococcus citreus]
MIEVIQFLWGASLVTTAIVGILSIILVPDKKLGERLEEVE